MEPNFFGAPPPAAAEMPPPTAPPAAPAVPLTQEATQRLPTWGDPVPDATDVPSFAPDPQPEPEPEVPAGPTMEQLRAERDVLQRRLHDTQQGFHQANNNTRLAQEIVAGLTQAADYRRAREAQQEALAPPSVPDPDALLTDPNALMATLHQYVDYGYRRAMMEVQPHLQSLSGIAELAPTMLHEQMQSAADRAERLATQRGISAEEFQQLLPEAVQIIGAGNIPDAEKIRLRLRPDALVAAAELARNSRGPRSAAPPSLGPGAVGAPAQRAKAGDVANVQKMLGIKFSKDALKELDRRLAAQGVR